MWGGECVAIICSTIIAWMHMEGAVSRGAWKDVGLGDADSAL
jgi:hypothetical protein